MKVFGCYLNFVSIVLLHLGILSSMKFDSCLGVQHFSDDDLQKLRDRVTKMFYHAYDSYLKYAEPYDELRPLSCDGVDTWGSFSLSLIDSLDTLAVMGNFSEFQRVAQLIVKEIDFNSNINVSVFETNIRVVGGLLSAHLLSRRAGVELEPGWPCSGPLLRLAENVARRLLPAFQTKTGMPYGTVNLKYGVPAGETPVTCTAGVSTFIVEFGALSRLTGDPIFEDTALAALRALWNLKSPLGLVGNHINSQDGKWTAVDSGIGAGVDSYFEYLVKGAILLQLPELMEMFNAYRQPIEKYMKRDDWYLWVSMNSGQVTMPVFQSLEAYWPGILSLVGDIEQGQKSLYNYHQVWRQYGFIPEFYDIPHSHVTKKREGYPLRPEFIESAMYLYQATRDPLLLQLGVDVLESIEHSSRTSCGYATIKNVLDHKIEDRMESFFLAETTKYLYLLFDPDNFLHRNGDHGEVVRTIGGDCVVESGSYIFNTEAHPIDIAAVYCCSAERKRQEDELQDLHDSLNLFQVLKISSKTPQAFLYEKWHNQKSPFQLIEKAYYNLPIHKEMFTVWQSETDNTEKNVSFMKSKKHPEVEVRQPVKLSIPDSKDVVGENNIKPSTKMATEESQKRATENIPTQLKKISFTTTEDEHSHQLDKESIPITTEEISSIKFENGNLKVLVTESIPITTEEMPSIKLEMEDSKRVITESIPTDTEEIPTVKMTNEDLQESVQESILTKQEITPSVKIANMDSKESATKSIPLEMEVSTALKLESKNSQEFSEASIPIVSLSYDDKLNRGKSNDFHSSAGDPTLTKVTIKPSNEYEKDVGSSQTQTDSQQNEANISIDKLKILQYLSLFVKDEKKSLDLLQQKNVIPDLKSIPFSSHTGQENIKNDSSVNILNVTSFDMLTCPAQPFTFRFSLLGELFNTD
ncbi:ER degradation-enhancing alpha-mannosidase-like protein 2 [Limulus polyphemus]|uniref:alpha-1,2-Mannosidase n=1 Tax=Limulus polyphemus TaxID=6850 RepID=A0ABM1BSM0_LIMPO|nr:ER degradation-enhancing alpha-mannosidase-like protein 2 [Limulus polyphemus]